MAAASARDLLSLDDTQTMDSFHYGMWSDVLRTAQTNTGRKDWWKEKISEVKHINRFP